jgi:formylglycine-generating enzyme required for sulfatase activity
MKKLNSGRNLRFLSFFMVLIFITAFIGKEVDNQVPDFKSYKTTIPGSNVPFEMVVIPGGEYMMGSQKNEKGRKDDEGPAHTVKVEPFWMGKYEITWDEFELFVYQEMEKQQAKVLNYTLQKVDGVTRPTAPFVDMSFGMGKKGFPAVNMTHYAALAYCKWLSAKTGDFYRLPTEAEWEYACRAGSKTAFSYGDDPKKLGEYAWFYENSNGKYQQVGKKKPNAWGLHDMHGNVAEWTLDQYKLDFYTSKVKTKEEWAISVKLYPHSVRGGSWDDDPEDLRSAARRGSNPNWKQRDPQIPKSNWWLTDASFVGFRIVRPVKKPSQEEIKKYFQDPIQDY